MEQLLEAAQLGNHSSCKDCPWSPEKVGPLSFGVSCRDHGFDWSSPGTIISMLIAQDPAGTTPEKTGCLCFVCNRVNPKDKTAQHAYDLWKATVSFDVPVGKDPYLKNHYWTNALLHGASKKSPAELRKTRILNVARQHCAVLLNEQINILSPRIIIATGEIAADSLYENKLITVPWVEFNDEFINGAYSESTKLLSGITTTVFCTYHTAATPVSTHVAQLYPKTKKLLEERMDKLQHYTQVKTFMQKYQPKKGEGEGMLVLLLHWLEIGLAIREIHKIEGNIGDKAIGNI